MFTLIRFVFSLIFSFRLLLALSGLALVILLGDAMLAKGSSRVVPAISPMAQKLVAAAIERTKSRVIYDPSYVAIAYPGGDVPDDRGVCADVVIRAYRQGLGIDLQKRVHEDMVRAFSKYPKRWGLKRTDKNIDHRRVPNLRTFFTRHGQKLAVSADPASYRPGDLVTWDLARGPEDRGSLISTRLPHIGIVTNRQSYDGKRPLVVHNAGGGTRLEDLLFDYKITGHYRYLPKER